jgi:hypothetical protein
VQLPYERVAAMLNLAPDQVGMIIRRARVRPCAHHRAAARAPRAACGRGRRRAAAVRAALAIKAGAKAVKGLMTHQSIAAARRKLADLVYEMSKAAWSRRWLASNTLIRSAPPQRGRGRRGSPAGRPPAPGRRARGLGRVPLTHPAPDTALDDARACLVPSSRSRAAPAGGGWPWPVPCAGEAAAPRSCCAASCSATTRPVTPERGAQPAARAAAPGALPEALVAPTNTPPVAGRSGAPRQRLLRRDAPVRATR